MTMADIDLLLNEIQDVAAQNERLRADIQWQDFHAIRTYVWFGTLIAMYVRSGGHRRLLAGLPPTPMDLMLYVFVGFCC